MDYLDGVSRLARKQMADTYRRLRKENPAMARLVYLRVKEAEKQIIRGYHLIMRPPLDTRSV
jgi:hypothetical protein